jgi:hypothetical protein
MSASFVSIDYIFDVIRGQIDALYVDLWYASKL